MVIPEHLNPFSILFLAVGIFILIKNKQVSKAFANMAARQFETYSEGEYKETNAIMTKRGFYRFFVIAGGVMLVVIAWGMSFGPLCIGSAAEGNYCYQLAATIPH